MDLNGTLDVLVDILSDGKVTSKEWVTIGGIILIFLLNLYQSFRMGHFNSKCFHPNGKTCCEADLDEGNKSVELSGKSTTSDI